MKELFSGIALMFLASFSYGQSTDPDAELVKNEFDAYFNDFNARDFDAIATHFQVPAMFKRTPDVIATTHEEVVEFFSSFPLQEGYAYSLMDHVEVHRLAESIYYLNLEFSRYNSSDELLFEGSSLYFFSDETGSWKIFTLWTGDRE